MFSFVALTEAVERLPLLSDPEFLKALHKELYAGGKPWECAGLQALTLLAWGLVLATVRSTHHGQQIQGVISYSGSVAQAELYVYRVYLINT